MNNQSKNGGTLNETIPCQADMAGVTTMSKKDIIKIISFLVMSDGGVYSRDPKWNAQFIMNMKKEHSDFLCWIKNILEKITSVIIESRKDYNTDGCTRKEQLRIYTKTHPTFTKLRDQIYINNYKSLSNHYLKMIDAQALAILYMCDGSLAKKKKEDVITLNLKRLSYGDQELLRKTIKNKFDIEFNINKNGKYFYLTLRHKDHDKFIDIVKPFIFNSFKYKITRTIDSENISDGDIV